MQSSGEWSAIVVGRQLWAEQGRRIGSAHLQLAHLPERGLLLLDVPVQLALQLPGLGRQRCGLLLRRPELAPQLCHVELGRGRIRCCRTCRPE